MTERDVLTRQLNEALGTVAGLVRQHCCPDESGRYDSMCLSANAEAMELLAEHGRFKIETGFGRRVFGRFPED